VIASGWGDQRVTIRALLLLGGVSLALASLASAQSPAPNPSPPAAFDPPPTAPAPPPPPTVSAPPTVAAPPMPAQAGMPPQRIHAMVRASGFDPIGAPVRRGDFYVQRALDPNAIAYRVVVDARTGRIMSVRPLRMAYGGGPYGPYPPPYRPAYGRYYGPSADDFGYGPRPHPPRSVPTARLAPPQPLPPPSQPSQPQQSDQPPRAQPTTTAQAPLPRPKPYVMEATGSIPIDAPTSPAPQKAPEPQKAAAPPAPAPQSDGAAALPPVAPLD
jgi:hypothetical protein